MTLPLILGIDPGPVTSGVVLYDPVQGTVVATNKAFETDDLIDCVRWRHMFTDAGLWDLQGVHLAMETIVSYGARIGMETITNIELIGRIKEAWSREDDNATYLSRPDILGHLTGRRNAKEADCADRLKEMHGGLNAVGTKKNPGPLYGVTSHTWSALAVAVVASDILRKEQA